MDTQMVLTHTGKIYFNRSLGLEFLTVGDYGKENNIKADFLGLTKKIEGVQHHDVDLMDKWVATISSQKGCPMKCTFCDVHKYGFFGNASLPDLEYQIRYIIEHEDIRFTNRFNVHYRQTERAGKRTGERGKEELPLKQKATVCTPPKGADRGYFFNFRPRHFQPWAN